jgi:hypothetical protein
MLTTKFVWPCDEFPARTIMKRHPEHKRRGAANIEQDIDAILLGRARKSPIPALSQPVECTSVVRLCHAEERLLAATKDLFFLD